MRVAVAVAFAALSLIAALHASPAHGAGVGESLPGVAGQAPLDTDEQRERALDAPRGAQPVLGRAARVYDGDSFALLAADGRRLQIRLSGIDAPEKGQPFSDRSRRHLAELLAQHELVVTPIKKDVYGRLVANVSVGDRDVGLAQLRAGLAWHFIRYAHDQTPQQREAYARAESEAREARIGLWMDSRPLEPWRFREMHRHRNERPAQERAARAATASPCAAWQPRTSGCCGLVFRVSG